MAILMIFHLMQEWDSCNRQEFIKELAKKINAKVICINRPGDLLTSILSKKSRDRLLKTTYTKDQINHLSDNLDVIRPYYLLHDQIAGRIGNLINGILLHLQLQRLGYKLREHDQIIHWIYSPLHLPITVMVKSAIIYEIYDEITLYPWDKINKNITKLEPTLLQKADLIFILTKRIAKKRSAYENKITVIGNGVNLDKFAFNKKIHGRPPELEGLSEPIICLSGIIRSWIDFNLIKEILLLRPNWNFIVIGPIENNIKSNFSLLRNQFPNLKYLGIKKYDELINYFAYSNVGIIPYIQTEFIRSSRPLKLIEYLAAGIPVVTVPIDQDNIEEISGAISIATSADEFIRKIERILSMDRLEIKNTCISIASRYSWSHVVDSVIDVLGSKWNVILK